MKIIAVALIHAIVLAATTDAARQVVLNGGRILSSDGQYIDGKCWLRIRVLFFYL